MADKETKTKSSPKAETGKAAKGAPAKAAAKTTSAKSAKPETKSVAAKADEKSSPKATASKPAKKPSTPESVVAKYSNPSGRKPLVVEEEPVKKTAKKSEDAKVAAVVEKHTNSRGKKTGVVDDLRARKTEERYVAMQDTASSDGTAVTTKKQTIMLWILIGVLIAALLSGVILGAVTRAFSSSLPYAFAYKSAQQVGYYAEQLGTVDRVKPVSDVRNLGLSAKGYPTYGKTLNLTTEEKTALILESRLLTANGTWVDVSKSTTGTYDKMDKDGYLYLKDGSKPAANVPDRLYQHTASIGMYGGNVADSEKAVIKKLYIRPRTYGSYYSVTGLYAPAGEVIKVELSDADMNATGGITIHIGQALYNGQANNIWEQRGVNRMPIILNTMNVTKETATYDEKTGTWTGYVGSFLGGPIYVRSESPTFSVTISGGVNYSHFILGATTKDEFERNAKSTAPYFDLEVWDRGVLHSGPSRQAAKYSYDDLYNVAVLWEKVSMVTTTGSNQGVVFLYDPFVAAGAAVAFPGRRSVNCPEGWMKDSLNYKGIVSGGSWGNFHEYHHNFQNYGLGSGADGEVTNNGLTLVSYSLFTQISSKRQISGYGGSGLGGWNSYTSATWALNRVNTGAITSTNGLAVYATLLHNFGQDQYIKARGASGKNNYLNKWATNTHQDMTYYANMINAYGGGDYTPSQAVKDANYPLFVPVSSVYQTGRTYMYDDEKREINTMQPYVIPYGETFTVDLTPYKVNSGGQYESGSVVIGNGFKYNIKSVDASKAHGTFTETDTAGVYTFTPNKNAPLLTGKIYVTLEITTESGEHEWNGHKLDDVDLVLEFEQTHAKTKTVLERTTYVYDASNMIYDAEEAYNKNFGKYNSVETINHTNPTQNANTDVWYVPDTEQGHKNFPNAKPEHFAKENSIVVIEGKLFFEETGKYRVYLRGRKNCAVYYSLDEGKTFSKGATIKDTIIPANSAQFRPDDPNTYFDIEITEKDSWMYFKEILIVENVNVSGTSYIGLGVKQWQEPMFTIQQKYYDKDGKEVAEGSENIARTETKYFNHLGIEVSADVANNTGPIAPTSAEINSRQPYVNAYRSSYKDESAEFAPGYFYNRDYTYNYTDNKKVNSEQTLLTQGSKYTAPPTGWGWGNFPIANVADGNRNTFIHTKDGVSEKNPLVLVFDMGEVKSVNRMIIYSQYRPNGDWKVAKSFTLQGSIDGVEFFEVGTFVDVPRNGANVTVDFEEKEFRFYILTVTQSYNNHIIIGEIEMWHTFEVNGAKMYSPFNEQIEYYGNWSQAQAFSSFGLVAKGSKNANIKFEFEGTRLGILSSKKFGTNFEVYIDGQKVTSLEQVKPLEEQNGEYGLSFLSDLLEEGKHTVTIKCLGEANFDSFVIYP